MPTAAADTVQFRKRQDPTFTAKKELTPAKIEETLHFLERLAKYARIYFDSMQEKRHCAYTIVNPSDRQLQFIEKQYPDVTEKS